MEDAHLCKLDIEDDISIFGVFDGHGGNFWILGKEVAHFVKENLITELLKNEFYKNK